MRKSDEKEIQDNVINLLKKHNIYDKKEIVIIVTDSGLGGIAVAAELYHRLRKQVWYENVRIIFFNSLFDEKSGYHRLDSLNQKVNIFNSALNGMLDYSPDLILIACNMLSLLYPYTTFSQTTVLPVIGIVEIGINYILRRVHSDRNASVIIFATPITISEGTYKNRLTSYLSEIPIIEQACPELAFAIGDGEKEKTHQLINKYTLQVIQRLPTKNVKVYASLNCTHFGYYQDAFLRAFQRNGLGNVEILNPNSEMVKLLLLKKRSEILSRSEVTIEFVSKVKINRKGMESLIPFLELFSKDVVSAFQNYHYNPDLF